MFAGRIFWKFFKEVFIIILTIALVLFGPILISILTPIFLLRFIVSKSSKYVRPDLGKILTTRSTLLAVDDINTKPQAGIIVSFAVKGNLVVENVRQTFLHKAVNAKAKDGELRYPEFQQYPHKWMGFMFWKWDEDFDIKYHIRYHKDYNVKRSVEGYTQEQVDDIASDLLTQPFVPKKSPWELIIFPNVEFKNAESNKNTHSVAVLRIHHCVLDGFSMLKLFLIVLGSGETNKFINYTFPQKSKWRMFCEFIWYISRSPYECVKTLVESNDNNSWKLSEEQQADKFSVALSEQTPMNCLKEIKSLYGVSIMCVILAGVTGSMRKAMLKQNVKVPETMHALIPVPMPGHPDKLRNHVAVTVVPLPIGEPDPIKRLKLLHKTMEGLKRSTFPKTIFLSMKVLGALFAWMARIVSAQTLPTLNVSNFPGPLETLSIFGHEIVDLYFGAGFMKGVIGMGYTFVSHAGVFKMRVAVNRNILSDKADVAEMVKFVHEEFELLKNQEKV